MRQGCVIVLTKLLLNFISNPKAFLGAGSISTSGSWPFSRALFIPTETGDESVDLGLGDQLDTGAASTWGTNCKTKRQIQIRCHFNLNSPWTSVNSAEAPAATGQSYFTKRPHRASILRAFARKTYATVEINPKNEWNARNALWSRAFGLSITRNLITRVLTICHVKLTQITTMKEKRFDIRSLSPAIRNFRLLLVAKHYKNKIKIYSDSNAPSFLPLFVTHLRLRYNCWFKGWL